MIVPTDSILFRASPAEVLNFSPVELPAAPSARTLTWLPLLCSHGQQETGFLCPYLKGTNVNLIALDGGHYLDVDFEHVASVILDWLKMHVPDASGSPLRQPG